jgi:histidinol-phosphatase
MSISKKQLQKLLAFSIQIVKSSSSITMKYFGRKVKTSLKPNKSPVTIADLKCEEYLIKEIKKKYPSHDIYSEESGREDNGSEFMWIIDPLDGTKNFIRQFPYWGTLLALEYGGEIILGIISMPALKEFIYASRNDGCFINGRKTKVSNLEKIENSFCIFGGLDYILKQSYRNKFLDIASKCYYSRGFGDCHGHSFIIKGQAEFMIDPHTEPYDVAATKICVEEAGGMLTDTKGNRSIYNGDALISNGRVHEEVIKMLNG